jgi:hypothetical protein
LKLAGVKGTRGPVALFNRRKLFALQISLAAFGHHQDALQGRSPIRCKLQWLDYGVGFAQLFARNPGRRVGSAPGGDLNDMLHDFEIHLEWEGPLSLEKARNCCEDSDWGVYQIYGFHPAYGAEVLLYIGKAQRQYFGNRLSQEKWWEGIADAKQLKVYLGRLAGKVAPDDETWNRSIDLAERLLIHVHRPAWNAQKSVENVDEDLQQVHLFNWGSHRSLLPEVSDARWTKRLNTITNWHVFKCVEPRLQRLVPTAPASVGK